jgi:ribokinase
MVGCLGEDRFGEQFTEALQADGVRMQGVAVSRKVGTGVGLPVVDVNGDNSIIVIPRANSTMTPRDIDSVSHEISAAKVVLLQLELPVETQLRAAQVARSAGTTVILNTAPAAELPSEFLPLTDILIANEGEILLYSSGRTHEERVLALQHINANLSVILTLGASGAITAIGEKIVRCPAPQVKVVDTVGAGDVFCGYLAASLAQGLNYASAIDRAVHAASLSVTIVGSGLSAPSSQETRAFMAAVSSASRFDTAL